MNTMIVPPDGSPLAERVLPYVQYLAPHYDADVRLLRVVRDSVLVDAAIRRYYQAEMTAMERQERWQQAHNSACAHANGYLFSTAARLHGLGIRATTDVCDGAPADAVDCTPYADLIARLEHAIGTQQIISFSYAPTYKPTPTQHPYVEPYAIEFYERHFYLVAYTRNNQQVQDFRIDRIQPESVTVLPGGSWSHRRRRGVRFGYRLAATLARGELSQRFTAQQIIERRSNGDVIIEAVGRSDFFIVQTLLRYRANAELLWPERLRAQMAADVRALAAVYGGGRMRRSLVRVGREMRERCGVKIFYIFQMSGKNSLQNRF